MSGRLSPTRRVPPRVLAVLVWTAVLLAAWLDRDNCLQVQSAGFIAVIVSAISWLGSILGTAGTAIAASAEAAVVYLASAVGWLAQRVAGLMLSTGGMFARAWEGLRIVWSDVLRPFLVWAKSIYDKFGAWLKKYFKPVFEFLSDVRTTVLDLYARFVRPVLLALDIAHAVLHTLSDLGVEWAKRVDGWVEDIRSTITENFIRVLGWINEVRDVVNAIVTPDRLLQRIPLIATLNRDAGYWTRIWWNSQIAPYAKPRLVSTPLNLPPAIPPEQLGSELGAYYVNGGGVYADRINAAESVYAIAAGEAPG